jgi:hypothetical protein
MNINPGGSNSGPPSSSSLSLWPGLFVVEDPQSPDLVVISYRVAELFCGAKDTLRPFGQRCPRHVRLGEEVHPSPGIQGMSTTRINVADVGTLEPPRAEAARPPTGSGPELKLRGAHGEYDVRSLDPEPAGDFKPAPELICHSVIWVFSHRRVRVPTEDRRRCVAGPLCALCGPA